MHLNNRNNLGNTYIILTQNTLIVENKCLFFNSVRTFVISLNLKNILICTICEAIVARGSWVRFPVRGMKLYLLLYFHFLALVRIKISHLVKTF